MKLGPLLAAMLVGASAQAAPAEAPEASPKPYAWKIVLTDALTGPGALVFAPIVHGYHRRYAQAAQSFVIRLIAMGAGAGVGTALGVAVPSGYFHSPPCARVQPGVPTLPCGRELSMLPNLVAGSLLGLAFGWLVGATIDATVLARPSVRVSPSLGGVTLEGRF